MNCADWHISYRLPIWASLYHWHFLLQLPCVMHLLHVAEESTSFGMSSIPDRKHWSRASWFRRPTVTLDAVCLVCLFQTIEQSGICTQCHGRQHSPFSNPLSDSHFILWIQYICVYHSWWSYPTAYCMWVGECFGKKQSHVLTFRWPTFTYAKACKKNAQKFILYV